MDPSGDLLLLNDELVDFLLLLKYDYPNGFTNAEYPPVSRTFFCQPSSTNAALQFKYFSQLVAWLVARNLGGSNDAVNWNKWDDPATVCTGISVLLKERFALDIPGARLKSGFGEGVLEVLHALSRSALERTQFQFLPTIYPDEGGENGNVLGGGEVDDDINEDESLLGGNEGVNGTCTPSLNVLNVNTELLGQAPLVADNNISDNLNSGSSSSLLNKDTSPLNNSQNLDQSVDISGQFEGVLETSIDPKQWALEVERVVPRLMTATASLNDVTGASRVDGGGNSAWGPRLAQAKMHKKAMEANSPVETLTNLSRDLNQLTERIRSKEAFINSQFDNRAAEFANTQEELKKVTAQHTALSESTLALQIEYNGLLEELEETKSRMESLSSTVTDTGPIVKIKDSFQRLRLETRQIEVKIGVLAHQLMQAKLSANKDGREGGDAMEV